LLREIMPDQRGSQNRFNNVFISRFSDSTSEVALLDAIKTMRCLLL